MLNKNSVDAEYSVIGGLLLDNTRYKELDLIAEYFHDEQNGIIFDAIESLINQRIVADVVTVADHIFKTTGINYLPMIANIMDNTPSASNIVAYANIVKDRYVKRKAEDIGIRLQEGIWTEENIIDKLLGELLALNQGKKSFECSIGAAVQIAIEYLDEIQASKEMPGISTGLTALDEMLAGYHKTDLVMVGGRPAMGKTAFMLNCAERTNKAVGIITSEQGRIQVAQRMLMMNGKINSFRMRTGKLDQFDWQNIIDSSIRLKKLQTRLYDNPAPTVMDITRQARRWKHNFNIELLMVDYLQRIQGDWRLKRHEQIDVICKTLKQTARELEIPVVALAQINRDVEKRPNKRPGMSDFKDSGAIEQESDVMITLYRDEIYNKDTVYKGIAEIVVPKNRHGPTGLVKTEWIGQYMLFENMKDIDKDSYERK